MKKIKQLNEKKKLRSVPTLKPAEDDGGDFQQELEKKATSKAALGDILRQPGDPDEVIQPKAKKNFSGLLPLVFISAILLVILGVVSGALFNKISVLEKQVLEISTNKIQGSFNSNGNSSNAIIQANTVGGGQFEELQKELNELKDLALSRNKNAIANNTGRISNLSDTTKELKQAIKMLVTEVEEFNTAQKLSVNANKSSKNNRVVSKAALDKLEKKQVALEKRLIQEHISLKKLESTIKNIGGSASGGSNSADLAGLKSSMANMEKQIKTNNESIDTMEMNNDKLKRSISLLRAESARVYRLVESSMKK